jgi:hypothetical protein
MSITTAAVNFRLCERSQLTGCIVNICRPDGYSVAELKGKFRRVALLQIDRVDCPKPSDYTGEIPLRFYATAVWINSMHQEQAHVLRALSFDCSQE